jgi:hypothetical protein
MAANNRGLRILYSLLVFATLQSFAADKNPGAAGVSNRKWNVQVEEVESGEVKLDPAFRVAIYENVITELEKTTKFETVYRSGDRTAQTRDDLLILKISVRRFQAGSETKRAVTTVAGATKIKAQFRLETPDGKVVQEDLVSANVRFFGNNLRVTHNLARNVASMIKKSKLPDPGATVSGVSRDLTNMES